MPILRLHRLRRQLPVGLVRRLLHHRAIPDDSIPSKTPGDLSSRSCQGRRLQPRCSRPCSLQLRHLDIRSYAALRFPLRQTILSGASSPFALILFPISIIYYVVCVPIFGRFRRLNLTATIFGTKLDIDNREGFRDSRDPLLSSRIILGEFSSTNG